MIEGRESYNIAIAKLNKSFVKVFNVIFSCHLLATRRQKVGEFLKEFLQALDVLSKDCNFRDVLAKQYCKDLVKDAFING